MREYNCKVYDMRFILYLNDQGREMVRLIEPNALFIIFSHENAFFQIFSVSDSEKHKSLKTYNSNTYLCTVTLYTSKTAYKYEIQKHVFISNIA